MVKLILLIIFLVVVGVALGVFIGSRVHKILDDLAKEDGSGEIIDKINLTGEFPQLHEIEFEGIKHEGN